MKVIIVTGSVGSGKTTLSRKLAKKLSFNYISVNKVIKDNKLSSGFDKKRKCKVIDVKKLNEVLISLIRNYEKIIKSIEKNSLNKKIKKGIVIDSHLSHYLPKKYVDLCIVTKCDIKKLSKRLKKRGYNKSKVKENVECEIFDVCLNEAKSKKHKVVVVYTTKGIKNKIFNPFGNKFPKV